MPRADSPTKPVTLVVTSCNRFDLLERTLSSFYAFNDYPIARTLIVEDSNNSGVYEVVKRLNQPGIDVILNGPSLGQLRSIDKAYAAVDTEYIFHCEDDWIFARPGIVRESVEILDIDPDIVMVMARQQEDMPYYFRSLPRRNMNGARYRKIGPRVHKVWFTFSFNPGLRRLSDYKQIPGGYASFTGEGEASLFYKQLGRSMAWLEDARVTHIGVHRHIGSLRRPLGWMIWHKHVMKAVESTRRRAGHYARLLGLSDGF